MSPRDARSPEAGKTSPGTGVTGRLTTHVLDTAQGRPAANVWVELFRQGSTGGSKLREVRTNGDGRIDAPLLSGAELEPGLYELLFHIGSYFRDQGLDLAAPAFLENVPVRFGIADPNQHYHVPLLISPYGYSTYRGS